MLGMSVWRSPAEGSYQKKGLLLQLEFYSIYNSGVHHSPASRAGTYQRFQSRHTQNFLISCIC